MTTKEKIKKFQDEFNPLFVAEVRRLLVEQKSFHKIPLDNLIEESVINYCKTGKRIRPFLILFFGDKDLEDEDMKHLTLASELFHLAALLQDDVMDESLVRRNVPTLNAIGSSLSKHNKNLGDHIGYLLGDVFWTAAMEHAAYLPQPIFKEFLTMIQRTVRGQFLDVFGMNQEYGSTTQDDVLARHRLKTAWYTFTSPVRLGCMLNKDHNSQLIEVITPIVEELGMLFQIRDDINDCIDNNSGKTLFGDILENQTTWVTLYIKENYPTKFKELLAAKHSSNMPLLKAIFTDIDLVTPYEKEFNKRRIIVEQMSDNDERLRSRVEEVLKLLVLK